jgi:thiamine biosynthesis lipoprotein
MKSTATMSNRAPETWEQHRFRAMNTAVEVMLYGASSGKPAAVEQCFRQAEARMSRFLPDSDLSRFNQWDESACVLHPDLFSALEVALWGAHITGGLYDPTRLDELERAGYDRTFEHVVEREGYQWRAPDALADAPEVKWRRVADYTSIHLDRASSAARKPAGLRLDLGGMGKGWTVDRAAEVLHGEGPFLVNAGGDLYASGKPGHPRGWRVAIEHPFARDRWIARLFLEHGGLATSTTAKRRWTHHGRQQHHLIDPRTGRPAETDAVSVTVMAQRTVLAELFAKAALLLGAEAGRDYLAHLGGGIEGLIYAADGRVLTTPGLDSVLDAVEAAGIVM